MSGSAQQPNFAWRYFVVLAVFGLLAVIVSGRLIYLQIESQAFLQDQGDRRVIRVENIPAYRGLIQDRNGEPLAVSTPVKTLWANPQELIDAQYAWSFLANKTGVSESSLRDRILRNQDKQFIYLRRHMNPAKAEEILEMNISGVYGIEEHRRYYPAGEVTSHLVGFTNIDELGQEGIELSFEEFLKGAEGKKRVIKDLRRRIIKDVGLIEPAAPGTDVTLSIDLRAQYLAYRELLSAVTEYKASSGSAVAIDIKTGEVLALVNQPSYNPNNRGRKDVPNFRNRAVTDVFEPGSTVKPFTVAAALDSGKWKAYSKVDTSPGYLRIGSKSIRDMSNYGVIDLGKIISKSSNVGASKLALSLDDNYLSSFFRKAGLGQATGVGFPGESVGMLPAKQKWRQIEVATLSYGYGLSVTALQLAQAYAILGSGGIKRQVSLLKVNGDVPGERVMDETIARQVVNMMEGVVDVKGTAKKARVPGYRVAGKTGTVHKVAASGYQDHRYIALFAGVAPVEDPAIALVVVIDDPKGDMYYGGQVAAPVFSRVMAGLLRVKNIPPDRAVETYVGLSKDVAPDS
ncbi:peptidoglycan D,D-transpeptidase FtsI family protein [Ketobacter alkanivorans]|uniref:Peptidoglycan D,D-transpeptidase FtsI n=1 Tax=Ketobacter alkanivorans TaxID=1917421 RepID=A0A2K9LP24_9GAMM|nr:penicillin-binding transpeptidase domain-containing protein [Ketobacter alkanivorans]AUM14088.1 cell division protein [Ketobacter alkanivorans]